MKNSTVKYFAYVRKSSEDKEKQALSIPAQKDKIQAQFPNLNIEFVEEERSAFIPYNRPRFEDMIKRMRRGERTGLIGWHPDRLSRNEVDASTITYMIRTGEIADLKLVTYHFDNTPEGIWMLQMALSQSQYESAKKGRDVKRGLEKKAQMGDYPGPAPLGYLNDKYEERGKKKVYTDAERHLLLRRMVEMMLTGRYTPPRIRQIANRDWGFKAPNGRGISRTGIYNLFSRPFYFGEYEYPVGSGNWHRGNHEPLYTREEYDRMQILLGRKGRPLPQTRQFIYREDGKIRCGECHSSITAEVKNQCRCPICKYKFSFTHATACPKCQTDIGDMENPILRTYILYHCTKKKGPCSQSSISEKALEEQIVAELSRLEITPAFKEWALDVLKQQAAAEIAVRADSLKKLRNEYDAVVRTLDGLIEMRANKELDEDEFRGKKAVSQNEKARLFARIEATDKRVDRWLEIAEQGFNFAETARARFADDTSKVLRVRREIFATLGSNYVLKDGKLSIEADNLLFAIKNVKEACVGEIPRFEPKQNGSVAPQMRSSRAGSASLLRVLDDVRTAAIGKETVFSHASPSALLSYHQPAPPLGHRSDTEESD